MRSRLGIPWPSPPLRSAIAAIDNAETVDAPDALAPGDGSPHVAGAVSGLGAAEVPRRPLTEAEMDAIVDNEIVERRQAALGYEHDADQDRASRLYAEPAVLRRVRGAFTEYAETNKLVSELQDAISHVLSSKLKGLGCWTGIRFKNVG